MRSILLRLAYDGTEFAGYQSQTGQRTVQGVLESALEQLHGRPVRSVVAGRTDAGVHAEGQHVSFRTDHDGIPDDQIPAAINSRLPRDVAVLAARRVPEGFHARYDARSRHYRYRMTVARVLLPHRRHYTWRIPFTPDLQRLNRDAAAVVGEHDFSTFATRREERDNMLRHVHYARFSARGADIEFAIGANGFLWRMVRSLTGPMLERERLRLRGDLELPPMQELLAAGDRSRAGTTAPAWGLYLYDVEYEA